MSDQKCSSTNARAKCAADLPSGSVAWLGRAGPLSRAFFRSRHVRRAEGVQELGMLIFRGPTFCEPMCITRSCQSGTMTSTVSYQIFHCVIGLWRFLVHVTSQMPRVADVENNLIFDCGGVSTRRVLETNRTSNESLTDAFAWSFSELPHLWWVASPFSEEG